MRELGRKKAARNGLLEEVVRAPRSAGPKKTRPTICRPKKPGWKTNQIKTSGERWAQANILGKLEGGSNAVAVLGYWILFST
jgi:hypothetical protein